MGLCGHLALSCPVPSAAASVSLGVLVSVGALGWLSRDAWTKPCFCCCSVPRLRFLAQLLKMFGVWSITAVKATGVGSPQSVVVKHTVDLLSLVAAPK